MQIDISQYPFNFPARKIRTVDGDTIIADIDTGFGNFAVGRNIRIIGLDTPEVRSKDELHKEAGIEVKRWVMAVVPEEFTVLSKDLDKYGRILGDVIWSIDEQWRHIITNKMLLNLAADCPYLSLQRLLLTRELANPYDGKGKRRRWTKKQLRHIISNVKQDLA